MLIEITYNVTDVYMSTTETPIYVEISFEQPGGSSAVWGAITGTLSNQTDLQNALNAKLDESTIDGGTEGQILSKASATDFDFAWINNYAKYLATNVRNQTGSTIGAFQVVYISGATGNKPLISLADADTEATSSKTYGVTATSIANNGTGDVVTAGELSGINTSAFNEGDLLWLSTTAGGVVTSPPAEPAHAVFIGYVVRSHPTLGVIDVAIQNGYELNELHGVQITTPTDNQGLFYNATSTLWENKSITTALGYTPVPTTRNITINGVTYDLSADRTYTISTGISGSGASGQVTYWTGASAVSGSSLFTWDNTGRILQLSGADMTQIINQTNTTLASAIGFRENGSTKGYIQYVGSAFSIANRQQLLEIQGNAGLAFRTGAEAARFFSNGNLAINSTSDLGTRLGVVGDTLLRGSGNTSATTALTVQNSDSANAVRILNNGQINFGSNNAFPYIRLTTEASGFAQAINGTKLVFISQDLETGSRSQFAWSSNTLIHTSGNLTLAEFSRDFTPTSGTGTVTTLRIAGAINQTGGANGITRGLYVNPTLTLAADWRSIEWSNNSGWGLYGAGTANNYMAGSLGIGTSTNLAGINLYVNKNIVNRAGGNGFGIANEAIVQSIVTNLAASFASYITTQNTNFSLTNIRHYSTESATTFPNVTAGGSVTNQYGYWADSTLTGATNNYAFYGNIASGTGRWNLYMNGTADNYLAGNLGIGITPTVRLHVSGDTILRGSGATSATTALTVQNSSSTNLLNILNDGKIGIGTNAPATDLHINSTFATSSFQITRNGVFASDASFNITNGTGQAGQFLPSFIASSNYVSGAVTEGLYFTARINNNNSGDRGIIFDARTKAGAAMTQGWIASFDTFGNSRMRISHNGNMVLQNGGAFTDNGQRLQVYGDTLLRGSGATSGTTALTVQNSSGTNLFTVRNDGRLGNVAGILFSTNAFATLELYNGFTASNNYVVAHNTVGVHKFGFGTIDTSPDSSSFYNFIITRTGALLRDFLSTTTNQNGSSVLELSSTSRGFLPPRMTTTQRNAISSPAAGLVVYDTTDNKHYGYDGTTWNAFY